MPRIRTIKPEFWGDEKIAPLSPIDRLVFLGLISMADDAGRVVDSIRAIDGFIFPETEDSAKESLERLAELGRIQRGVTASGQRVVQLVNWQHQKIDKPNFAAALPPISLADKSATQRRAIPAKLRAAIFDRDGGACKECSTPVRLDKRDKYDADDDLAEIDHILPVIEGGTNDPENLQLLCLKCNRKKAGEDVRRRNAERSATNQRNVAEASTPHINDLRPATGTPTGDQRPTTTDQRPPTAAARERPASKSNALPLTEARDELVEKIGGGSMQARCVDDFLDAAPADNRYAWARGLVAMLDPPGGQPVKPTALLVAMQDFLVADRERWPFVGRVFRAFVDDANRPRRTPASTNPADALAEWARETDAREAKAKAHV